MGKAVVWGVVDEEEERTTDENEGNEGLEETGRKSECWGTTDEFRQWAKLWRCPLADRQREGGCRRPLVAGGERADDKR